jgi:hypothetical protein
VIPLSEMPFPQLSSWLPSLYHPGLSSYLLLK